MLRYLNANEKKKAFLIKRAYDAIGVTERKMKEGERQEQAKLLVLEQLFLFFAQETKAME